jgi:ubiquinol-cytochrome c reductase iron-sulfur subunit
MHCTHLGCVPQVVPTVGPEPWDDDWKGGFFCPCHKSKFDLSGRVYKGVPAPTNLRIPPYRFLDEQTLLIGVNPEGVA